jgi:hypothetical protein
MKYVKPATGAVADFGYCDTNKTRYKGGATSAMCKSEMRGKGMRH